MDLGIVCRRPRLRSHLTRGTNLPPFLVAQLLLLLASQPSSFVHDSMKQRSVSRSFSSFNNSRSGSFFFALPCTMTLPVWFSPDSKRKPDTRGVYPSFFFPVFVSPGVLICSLSLSPVSARASPDRRRRSDGCGRPDPVLATSSPEFDVLSFSYGLF